MASRSEICRAIDLYLVDVRNRRRTSWHQFDGALDSRRLRCIQLDAAHSSECRQGSPTHYTQTISHRELTPPPRTHSSLPILPKRHTARTNGHVDFDAVNALKYHRRITTLIATVVAAVLAIVALQCTDRGVTFAGFASDSIDGFDAAEQRLRGFRLERSEVLARS